MRRAEIDAIVARGEGPTLEFKRSTGELRGAMQTLCAFLNGDGGMVLFGVSPDGKLTGQPVSDATLRDVAQAFERFEPAPEVRTARVAVTGGREILALSVAGVSDAAPFVFEGRAYERALSTTRRMPQARYESLLLDRAHSRRRWENQVAEHTSLRDIDRDEIYRITDLARAAGRLFGPTERDLGRALDRLGLRLDGRILRAAVVLFGKRFMPDFPQCQIRLARFRGVDKAEFLDQRAVHAPAFKLLDEAELFCQRHFPLPGRIVPGRMERVDRPLIPPDALREILINALIHRDWSIAGGDVGVALFDDRVEVWSPGRLPVGVTAEALTRDHDSVRRNPTIAGVFFRAGLIEQWGRGTNRVAAMCRKHGIAAPEFREAAGSVVVTFRVAVGRAAEGTPQVAPQVTPQVAPQVTPQVTPQVAPQVTPQVATVLLAAREPKSREELQNLTGLRNRKHFRTAILETLLSAGWLEMTIPDKPNSRLQRYRTTDAGSAIADRHDT